VGTAFPQAEVGVYVRAPGIAADVLRRVTNELPELSGGRRRGASR